MPSFKDGNDWRKPGNHDSSLNYNEVCNIARRICHEVPGMKDPATQAGMDQAFKDLSDVLQDRVPSNPAVILNKGIHQDDELHFTLTVNFAHKGAFHVYLTKGNKRIVYSPPLRENPKTKQYGTAGKAMPHELYEYKPIGITYEESASNVKKWPLHFSKNSYPGRVRGNSFSGATADSIKSTPMTSEQARSPKLRFSRLGRGRP